MFLFFFLPGRRGVTLGKPDIKVETVNKEAHSPEEEATNASTATRMVKAMYSVSTKLSQSQEGGVEQASLKRQWGRRSQVEYESTDLPEFVIIYSVCISIYVIYVNYYII